jgi:hypothetical protein
MENETQMKSKYEVYVRIEEIGAIGKTMYTWLVSKDGMPSSIRSEKGVGPDCGGTILNDKPLETAVNEMDSQIKRVLSPKDVVYMVGNAPWESGLKEYIDSYGLTNLVEALNKQ